MVRKQKACVPKIPGGIWWRLYSSTKLGPGPYLSEKCAQVMTAVAAACRRAVLEAEPRLVEAMYLCQVCSSVGVIVGAGLGVKKRDRCRKRGGAR